MTRPTVAIVGAGFSGVLTALHLLEAPHGPRVRLIERRGLFGRGVAYAPPDADELLNVRASNMSAYPDEPRHFVEWLARGRDEPPASAFVSRRLYGDYLQSMLRKAAERSGSGRLSLEPDGAVAASRDGDRWRVSLGMGRTVEADAMVLAIGNLPPHTPPGIDGDAASSAAYLADPWSPTPSALPSEGLAVLMGTGLTMVDVALRLARQSPRLRMLAISRRGLLPRPHLLDGPAPAPWTPTDGASPRAVLHELRRRSEEVAEWRAVLDGMRPHVQALWSGWPADERARFLRHVRPWWDVHRHRLAPAVAARLSRLIASRALSVSAGRIMRVSAASGGLEVVWGLRGARRRRRVRARLLVNCTGPQGDLARCRDPLLGDLVGQGHVRADACRLGIDVDLDGRVIDTDGRASRSLFAVGPVTRGALWETTSVPDIRVQAAHCADQVLSLLSPDRAGLRSMLQAS